MCVKAMAGLGMPRGSDSLTPVCPHPALPFPQSTIPYLRLSCKSRHFPSPCSFFQEDAGRATDSIHGQLCRELLESSKTPKSSHNGQSEEHDKTPSHSRESSNTPKSSYNGQSGEHDKAPSHSRVDSSSNVDTEAGDVLREEASGNDGGNELEDGYRMTKIADRLIDVFLIERTTPNEWRKLLAFSKEWSKIRSYFFKHCRGRAEQELDPQIKGNLLKLYRKLKEVDDDMERHNELLAFVKENDQDIDTVVARRRKDFTVDFFQHLELLYQASYQQPNQQNGQRHLVPPLHDSSREYAETCSQRGSDHEACPYFARSQRAARRSY